ncbi:MAG: hypothetical protein O2954_01380 [bacterium]|nr:hypothetical protein [bacterium]
MLSNISVSSTLWSIPQTDPIIPPGKLHPSYDVSRTGAAHVVRIADTYRMLYWGSDRQGLNYILQAETSIHSPNNWEPAGEPLLGPQPETTHNCQGPGFPFLLPVENSPWLLYFVGWGYRPDGKLPNTTGVAISEDQGQSWRYHNEHPVLPLDRDYDREGTGSVWVLHEQGRFRMYYTAIGKYKPKPKDVQTGHGDIIPEIGIAYAESTDGIQWEKTEDNLIVKPRGFNVDPYEYICSKPCVIKTGSTYTMWVNTFGTAYRVHRLTSTNGKNWQWSERTGPDGEFHTGTQGAFDDQQRCYPTVIPENGTYRCWFTGNGFGKTGMGYAESTPEK